MPACARPRKLRPPPSIPTDFGGGSGGEYKHIFVGSQRTLTKKVKSGTPDQQHWFYHGDHLGSTSLVTSEVGQLVSFGAEHK